MGVAEEMPLKVKSTTVLAMYQDLNFLLELELKFVKKHNKNVRTKKNSIQKSLVNLKAVQ